MNSHHHNPCDAFGELISASLDNELTTIEQTRLDEHLTTCEPCRLRCETFRDLDLHVRNPVEIDCRQLVLTSYDVIRRDAFLPARRGRRTWASVRSFVAAAIVLAGFVGFVRFMQTSTTPQLEKEDAFVSRPLQNLNVISRQQRRTQEVVRETLQWELRTLKLELDQLDLNEEQSQRLHQRVADLMHQLEFSMAEFAQPTKTGETI